MWRSLLLAVVLVGVLAGCTLGGSSGGVVASSDGNAARLPQQHSTDGRERIQAAVERLTVPPSHAWHLTAVRCSVTGILVVCHGDDPQGRVRRAEFRVPRPGRLIPVCASRNGNVMAAPNILCVYAAQ